MKNHKNVMMMGMAFLLVAMIAQFTMHPTHAIGADLTDGLKGLLFGLAIGFNLLALRLRNKAAH